MTVAKCKKCGAHYEVNTVLNCLLCFSPVPVVKQEATPDV